MGVGRRDAEWLAVRVTDLIGKGVLTRDRGGRIIHVNGTAIRRVGRETFIEAYEQESRPVAHFIMVEEGEDSDEEPINEEEKSDEETS